MCVCAKNVLTFYFLLKYKQNILTFYFLLKCQQIILTIVWIHDNCLINVLFMNEILIIQFLCVCVLKMYSLFTSY